MTQFQLIQTCQIAKKDQQKELGQPTPAVN